MQATKCLKKNGANQLLRMNSTILMTSLCRVNRKCDPKRLSLFRRSELFAFFQTVLIFFFVDDLFWRGKWMNSTILMTSLCRVNRKCYLKRLWLFRRSEHFSEGLTCFADGLICCFFCWQCVFRFDEKINTTVVRTSGEQKVRSENIGGNNVTKFSDGLKFYSDGLGVFFRRL